MACSTFSYWLQQGARFIHLAAAGALRIIERDNYDLKESLGTPSILLLIAAKGMRGELSGSTAKDISSLCFSLRVPEGKAFF